MKKKGLLTKFGWIIWEQCSPYLLWWVLFWSFDASKPAIKNEIQQTHLHLHLHSLAKEFLEVANGKLIKYNMYRRTAAKNQGDKAYHLIFLYFSCIFYILSALDLCYTFDNRWDNFRFFCAFNNNALSK